MAYELIEGRVWEGRSLDRIRMGMQATRVAGNSSGDDGRIFFADQNTTIIKLST